VPEQYAGQQMRCPLCNNTFTVPGLPEMPSLAPPPGAAPQPAGGDPVYKLADEPGATVAAPMPPPPPPPLPASHGMDVLPVEEPVRPPRSSAPPPPPVPVGDYTKLRSITLSPRVIPWIGAIGVLVVLVLTFFPWWSGYDKEGKKEGYNAWSLAFGDGKDSYLIKTKDSETKAGGAWFILYVLLILLAALAAIPALLMQLKVIPDNPGLRPLQALKGAVVGGLAGVALILLSLYALFKLLDYGAIPLNFWGLLAYWVNLIAVIALLLQMWLELRGPSRPAPRIDIHT
jgi:hypothetical protein